MDTDMLIAQVTDLHVRARGVLSHGRVDTLAMAEAAVARLRAMEPRPDIVVVTGDLTDCGLPEEYGLIDELLATLPMPAYVIPGNHDRTEELVRGLRHRHRYLPAEDHLSYVVDGLPVRLVMLDTTVPGETHGELSGTRLRWVREALRAEPGRPTLLLMHHPPFATGIAAMDAIGCRNGDALAPVVREHPEIERVLAGHHHRPITVRWAGTVGYIAPSTAHSVLFDLRPDEPTRFIMEPPAISCHCWAPETGVVTHLVPVGDCGPPFDVILPPEYPGQSSQQETRRAP